MKKIGLLRVCSLLWGVVCLDAFLDWWFVAVGPVDLSSRVIGCGRLSCGRSLTVKLHETGYCKHKNKDQNMI